MRRAQLSLETIYNAPTQILVNIFRELMRNPNIGSRIPHDRLIALIVDEAHKAHRLSNEDHDLYNSKSMQFLLSISEDGINRLINAYHININNKTSKEGKILALYRHGVGYHDLLYAYVKQYDMIGGYSGVGKNGVYDLSGKVEKNQNDHIDTIEGNPFSYLSPSQLRKVSEHLGVAVPRGTHQVVMVTILYNYSLIYPDFINHIRNTNIDNINDRSELYIKAGLNNIDISVMETEIMSNLELKNLIRVGSVIMNPISPPRPVNKNYKQFLDNSLLTYDLAYEQSVNGFILKNNNIGFIFNIFNHHKNIDETVGYFAELAIYPPNVDATGYSIIRDSQRRLIKLILKNKYKTDDVMFFGDNFLIFIASRGYMLMDPNTEQIKARYNKLRSYSENIITKLKQIYNIPQSNTLLYELAAEKINPVEDSIISYKIKIIDNPRLSQADRDNMAKIYGAKIGMVIPPTIDNKEGYYWNNATKYNYVMKRVDNTPFNKDLLSPGLLNVSDFQLLMRNYTDQEIFGYTGIYTNYNSRDDLIDKVERTRRIPQFFIPTVRACSNADTITTLDSTLDLNVFIIAYGTMFEYYCYNLDDFYENFRDFVVEGSENLASFRFRVPNELNRDFAIDDIRALVPLLRLYSNVEGVNQMIDHINAGLARIRNVTDYDRSLLTVFNNLNIDKPLLRGWLYQLFYLGMYMRRWQGPPTPYPITRAETQGPDPNDKVNNELQILGYPPMFQRADGTYPQYEITGITAQLSANGRKFVDDLRAVEYIQEGNENIRVPRQENRTIGFYLDRVRKGNLCIRIASTSLIGTASYYLGLLFNENIPNFDPTNVTQIA